MSEIGDNLVLGRWGSSDGELRAAIPESSGFGTTMPSRALVLALKRSRTGAPYLTAASEPSEKEGWRLLIGNTPIPAGSPPHPVAPAETVTLQFEIESGDWVSVLAAHIKSVLSGPSEDVQVDPTTDPPPVSVLRDEIAQEVHTSLFGNATENWPDWAKAIAALTVRYQRSDLFNAYPHLKLASRINWMDAVTHCMGRTQKNAPKYTDPEDILSCLSRPLKRHNYRFDEVFTLSPSTSTDRGVWLNELTALLVKRAIVTEDAFEIVALAFAAADEHEKNRPAELEKKRQEKSRR
ncbi:hypothetical protein [Arthrobacter sp. efr-133-TYG-118]|uniref:hypothetical protein n=1 Tax=Arthrobacter sp. efr-133-TYG-118 TaxID=3040279 RepID=UPI0025506322|nr:hypothetical protein [Arthrobacter sp. efr-133-TYG-118]